MRRTRELLRLLHARVPTLGQARHSIVLHDSGQLMVAMPVGDPPTFHTFILEDDDLDAEPAELAHCLAELLHSVLSKRGAS